MSREDDIKAAMEVWDKTVGPRLSNEAPKIPAGWHGFAPELYATWRENGSPTERSVARKEFLDALRKKFDGI